MSKIKETLNVQFIDKQLTGQGGIVEKATNDMEGAIKMELEQENQAILRNRIMNKQVNLNVLFNYMLL